MAGARPEHLLRLTAVSAFDYRKKQGRQEYVRVMLSEGEGGPMAQKFPREGAGLLTSLTQSHGFAELGEEVTEVRPGDRLAVLPFAALF
jgi:molybdopterin molybdotransferase